MSGIGFDSVQVDYDVDPTGGLQQYSLSKVALSSSI